MKSDEALPQEERKLDFGSLAGLLVCAVGLLGGLLLEGGQLSDVGQITAALIVLGGTAGAVMITTPSSLFVSAIKRLPSVFWYHPSPFESTLSEILSFARKTRKSGVVSLEQQARSIDDPFLRKALILAVDGTDTRLVREIMQCEITAAEQRGDAEAGVFECAGGYAPTVGIIGAVLGLIQVMKHLGDTHVLGHGIAVAFVATVYGVSLANLFLLPVAGKLRTRLADDLSRKELIVEGVTAVIEGLHPFLLESKLEAFVQERTGSATDAKPSSPAAAKAFRSAAG